MAEGENDWIIEDSEEEDQLSSSQHDGHRPTPPLLPGAHIPARIGLVPVTYPPSCLQQRVQSPA